MDSKDVWTVVSAVGASLALMLHVVFPRYEWRTSGENGAIVVVTTAGRTTFSAVYDDHGKVTPMDPFKPF